MVINLQTKIIYNKAFMYHKSQEDEQTDGLLSRRLLEEAIKMGLTHFNSLILIASSNKCRETKNLLTTTCR